MEDYKVTLAGRATRIVGVLVPSRGYPIFTGLNGLLPAHALPTGTTIATTESMTDREYIVVRIGQFHFSLFRIGFRLQIRCQHLNPIASHRQFTGVMCFTPPKGYRVGQKGYRVRLFVRVHVTPPIFAQPRTATIVETRRIAAHRQPFPIPSTCSWTRTCMVGGLNLIGGSSPKPWGRSVQPLFRPL